MRHPPSPAQIRAARAMLEWSIVKLARAAQVSVISVQVAAGRAGRPAPAGTRRMIDQALAQAGVTFLEDDGDGAGLRLRTADGRPTRCTAGEASPIP